MGLGERGTGVTGSDLLGGLCRGHAAASVLCSDIRVYCSDLVGASTGGRDDLLVLVGWIGSVLLVR